MADAVVRMVVLVERDNPSSDVAVSRGWVVPESVFADLEATLRRVFGTPAQEGMRSLRDGQDVYVDGPETSAPREGTP